MTDRSVGGDATEPTPDERNIVARIPALRRDDPPKGDPSPPAEGLTLLSARPDIVMMADEKLRLNANRGQFSASEVRDMLLDFRVLANQEVLA
jgi:hypothetical protein